MCKVCRKLFFFEKIALNCSTRVYDCHTSVHADLKSIKIMKNINSSFSKHVVQVSYKCHTSVKNRRVSDTATHLILKVIVLHRF